MNSARKTKDSASSSQRRNTKPKPPRHKPEPKAKITRGLSGSTSSKPKNYAGNSLRPSGEPKPPRHKPIKLQRSAEPSAGSASIGPFAPDIGRANTLVIAVHALDGSAETDRLEAFGGVVGPAKAEQHQLDEQAAILDPQIAIIAREAERAAADGITAAGLECAIADQIIEASRTANQGTGPLSEPAINPNDEDGVIGYRRTDATPEIDERPLHITLGHLRTPLPGAPGDEQQDGDQEQPAA